MIKRHPHRLSHTFTATMNMGLNYPKVPFEVFPGESFRVGVRNLTRFLPQISPTMHDVNINVEFFQVPWRQLFDKLGISWDDFLTGGEDGRTEISIPTVVTPVNGYDPGSLADFLGIPTNFKDPETGNLIVQPSIVVSALPVLAYMHIINENYRDQNFIKKLDLNKYQEFLDGTYEFKDASGNSLGYDLFRPGAPGLFPRAWSRDYFGRALPDTQRGPAAALPLTGDLNVQPAFLPTVTQQILTLTAAPAGGAYIGLSTGSPPGINLPAMFPWQVITHFFGRISSPFPLPSSASQLRFFFEVGDVLFVNRETHLGTATFQQPDGTMETIYNVYLNAPANIGTGGSITTIRFSKISGPIDSIPETPLNVNWANIIGTWTSSNVTGVDLSQASVDMAGAPGVEIIQFRLAARMQRFGEVLQTYGARAVEYTMAFFGVRIPDDRVQRPIYHGAFRLPVFFSEVLQTSETSDGSPLANLGGHGISGGENKPIHVKVIEHGFFMPIVSVMPRSQFHNILPKMYLRRNRFDIPNPIFQHVGEQAIDQIEIFPRTSMPTGTRFGYVMRYSELGYIPSTVHGHMKDTFAHWHMARIYTSSEPVLSARFRYEPPTNRSFAIKDEDQLQVVLGFDVRARRVFARDPRTGIHIV